MRQKLPKASCQNASRIVAVTAAGSKERRATLANDDSNAAAVKDGTATDRCCPVSCCAFIQRDTEGTRQRDPNGVQSSSHLKLNHSSPMAAVETTHLARCQHKGGNCKT